jgi:hypothetical protein
MERTHDENYDWHQGDPPSIRRPSGEGARLIRAAGLWGEDLDQATTGILTGRRCLRVRTFVNRLSSDSAKHRGIVMPPQAELR